ncbi:hypothetical protein HNY73_001012 [Argiope bruennichi]|uniref:Uncharacterized protein n=1 Tax=Argiope bruennichi TaxID=94029 RepID=A0A8T0G604_ARGBR|nr:hypothetical protein HNY73_001012 [Argiope bruennichi]
MKVDSVQSSFWRALFGDGRTGGRVEHPRGTHLGPKRGQRENDGWIFKKQITACRKLGKTAVVKEKLPFVKVKPVWRECLA